MRRRRGDRPDTASQRRWLLGELSVTRSSPLAGASTGPLLLLELQLFPFRRSISVNDRMRWRYGDTNPVVAAVDLETVIEIGDLLWLDGDNAKPASS